jgi:hypothetical protein
MTKQHARTGTGRRLTVEQVAERQRWSVATAARYMGEMLRAAQPPGAPLTVTEAALERWLERNGMRPIGPTMTLPVSLAVEHT